MLYRFLPIIHTLARLNLLFSCILWAPALVSFYLQDGVFPEWILISATSFFFSFLIWRGTRAYQRELQNKDGFLLATLLWLVFALVAALPLYFSHRLQVPFINAYYEAISGLTTTGSSVFSNIEELEPSLNLWRHTLNWIGGMGIIVLAVAVIPTLGVGGTSIMRAEVSGVYKDKKLKPRITQTAKSLWGAYLVLTLFIILALKIAGMSLFDAVCHAFASISLGGFSTYSDSVGHFHSLTIEIILMVAMLLGTVNFVTHVTVLRNKDPRHYWQDKEVQTTSTILFCSILFASIYLFYYYGAYGSGLNGFLSTLRQVAFNYISVITTCGFSSVDFAQWPIFIGIIMYVFSNLVPNAGSTGGGIKTIRFIIQCKFLYRELVLLIHPNAVRTVKINNSIVESKVALNVMAFVLVYLLTALAVTLVFISTGKDIVSAFSFTIALLTNSGPGIGQLGPMADLNTALTCFEKGVGIFTMLIGRLELFTVFILFLPAYWKN
ncbi:MAG: potassium transporter TrkG [Neisseriaceae bacterium]